MSPSSFHNAFYRYPVGETTGVIEKTIHAGLFVIALSIQKSFYLGTNMEMINLSFLMEDVLSDFNRRHPSLRASFDIDNRILVKGTYDTLKGSVQSLIQGAIRFTDKSAHPCIVYGQVGCQQIHLMIDNGFGFKMDEMNDQGTTKKAAGFQPLRKTIKRVKVKHGGNVWGFAGEVIGAVFRFSPN